MMQYRAEMPKSVGQGVSLGLHGTKEVPASGLVLPAAVWVTGHWEVLVKLAIAESFGGGTSSQLTSSCVTPVMGVTCHTIEQFGKCGPRTASGPGGYSYLHFVS